MVTMDLPTAVKSYQFGERAKSELIMASQLCLALTGFPDGEKIRGAPHAHHGHGIRPK